MRNMKTFFSILILILITIHVVKGQNEEDALRYSWIEYEGNAQFNATGGAMGIIGNNVSAVSINPGSLASFREASLTFTPSLHFNYTASNYLSSKFYDNKMNFHIKNIGIALPHETSSYNWIRGVFAFGYNRLANFNRQLYFSGTDNISMLSDYTNKINSEGGMTSLEIRKNYPFDAALAYETYLINPISNDSLKYNHVLMGRNDIFKEQSIIQRGGMGEYYIAYAGNLNHKLLIGGSINFQTVRYVEEKQYREKVNNPDSTIAINEWQINEKLNTRGSGLNFKFGIVYAPAPWLKMGGSVHTPTYFELKDKWSSSMSSDFDTASYQWESPNGSFDYAIISPYRINAGITLVSDKLGFLGIEYEYVDYSLARLRSLRNNPSYYSFQQENNAIASKYTFTHGLRVGGELKIDPIRIRLGYRISESPMLNDRQYLTTFSGGIGFDFEDSFIDLTYTYQTFSYLYRSSEVHSPAIITPYNHSILLTFGWRLQ